MSDKKFKIEELKPGEGEEVQSGDHVIIHYTGWLEDGTVFDSSVKRGIPFKTRIGVGEVIAGWDMGVIGMKKGSKRKLTIPPELAYGDNAVSIIPGGSTLIFEVELLSINE
jgi:FKBP-type peptidyl-prolyl cis-trans isomerase